MLLLFNLGGCIKTILKNRVDVASFIGKIIHAV